MTREIPLYRNKQVAAYALVDDGDFEWLSQYRWSISNKGYVIRSGSTHILMHRLINNTPVHLFTDHRDGNRLNNQRHNLRNCTTQENNRNRGATPGTTSRFKGVCWLSGKWQATIDINRKTIYLGRYADELDAAAIYNRAAAKHFGEFAQLNDVPGWEVRQVVRSRQWKRKASEPRCD